MKDFHRLLATVIVAGPWTQLSVLARSRLALPQRMNIRWLPGLVERMCVHFGDRAVAPPQIAVARFLSSDDTLHDVLSRRKRAPIVDLQSLGEPVMMPASETFAEWELPELTTIDQLAEWFDVSLTELEQLADPHGFEQRKAITPARHYRYRWVRKRGRRSRLFETPKHRLKALQRRLLTGLLDHVPPHPAAHAFRRGHSVKTCLAPHTGRIVIQHCDLRDFFPSIRASQVFGLYRTLGYPEPVARLLTGLCTNRTPPDIRDAASNDANATDRSEWDLLYRSAHLPQGAPTSPAIANLIAYRLDCRLHGLAQTMNAEYTRYADDLVFSGDETFRRSIERFGTFVLAIVLDEGFHIRHRKTRILPHGSRQKLAGVIVNQRLNIPRREYDVLRATLFNCVRHGPASQNHVGHHDFRNHLLGRIGWVTMLNPNRGMKLRQLFEQIEWRPS